MRREQFTIDVRDVSWVEEDGDPAKPRVTIDFTGDSEALRDRLTDRDGNAMAAGDTDVSLRLLGPLEDDPDGVVAVTNRLTGEFILELNVDARDVLTFIRAARRYGEHDDIEGRYEIELLDDGEPFVTYEKRTFLVYNADGDLLRSHSLIPGGVEL